MISRINASSRTCFKTRALGCVPPLNRAQISTPTLISKSKISCSAFTSPHISTPLISSSANKFNSSPSVMLRPYRQFTSTSLNNNIKKTNDNTFKQNQEKTDPSPTLPTSDKSSQQQTDDFASIQNAVAGKVSSLLKRNPLLGKENETRAMIENSKRIGKEFWEATKQLYYDFKEAMNLRKTLRAQGSDALSRRQHRLLHHNKIDQVKLIPFILLQFLPVSTIWILLLCLRWPNVLPSTFTGIDVVKDRIATLAGREREKDSRVLRQAVVLLSMQTMKDCQDRDSDLYRAAVRTDSILRKIATHQAVSEIEEQQLLQDLIVLNKADIVTMNSLAYNQLYALTEFTRMVPFYPYRGLLLASLKRKCKYLLSDDEMIRREGIKSLTIHEVEEALIERGISPRDTEEENRYLLSRWLNQTLAFSSSEMFALVLSKCLVFHDNERLPSDISQV